MCGRGCEQVDERNAWKPEKGARDHASRCRLEGVPASNARIGGTPREIVKPDGHL
jgi:hypothetical protein